MPYDPMNQVHPGPQEGIDRIPGDATQARTGNTEREQETWFAGVEEGQRRTEHNAAVRSAWMPIDSAPKDGTMILLGREAIEDCDAISIPGFWQEGWEDSIDDMGCDSGFVDVHFQEFSGGRSFGVEAYRTAPNQPTHWQPLPAAPGSPASAAPGDAQDERQEFEAWFTRNDETKDIAERAVRRSPSGAYVLMQTYTAWEIWQAARASVSAPATDDTPPRFTISASDRFELTGAVGLLRGCGYVGPANALQRVLDAESASFSVQGEDDARDAGRYRTVRKVAADKENGYALMAEASREVGIEVGQYPTPEQFDAVVDLVAAQQGKGGEV